MKAKGRGMTPVSRQPLRRRSGQASVVTAFVALGSNLDDPPAQIRRALQALAALPGTRLERRSSLYRNPPTGVLDQPDFVNAVAEIETRLAARELLEHLLAIERAHGRVRDVPNGPRTLDLDLLLYGGLTGASPRCRSSPRMLSARAGAASGDQPARGADAGASPISCATRTPQA
jgi:2-amino-4-hydroxy-6-hydroxymethyldihydropteridine diphosphokinase